MAIVASAAGEASKKMIGHPENNNQANNQAHITYYS
jgi:hypothetical protein